MQDSKKSKVPISSHLKGHTHQVISLEFEPTRNQLLSGDIDGNLKIWDINSHSCTNTIKTSPNQTILPINSIAHIPASDSIAFAAGSNLFLFDVRTTKQPLAQLSCSQEEINQICVHPSGQYVATADDAGDVKII
eukprot:Sdes_comp15494_c0_seq1m4419